MKVELSELELELSDRIAHARLNACLQGNQKEMKISDSDPLTLDIIGMRGEFAFGKMYNLFPDMSLHRRTGGYDYVLNGDLVDVKTTDVYDGRLLLGKWNSHLMSKMSIVDIYALVTKDPYNNSTYHCKGWISSMEIIESITQEQKNNIKPMTYMETFRGIENSVVIYQKDLHDPKCIGNYYAGLSKLRS